MSSLELVHKSRPLQVGLLKQMDPDQMQEFGLNIQSCIYMPCVLHVLQEFGLNIQSCIYAMCLACATLLHRKCKDITPIEVDELIMS